MSVDKLRESRHFNRIRPTDLGLLLSAQSYRPEITEAIRRIKSFHWTSLQDLVANKIGPGPHPVYGGNYPCLKTKNVDGLIASYDAIDYADVSKLVKLANVQVQYGDLLINLTGAGSIGRVSIYYGDDLPITNQHIARMKVKSAYDAGYIAAFLRSWWGERALEQGIAGSTGQINMVNDHVRAIPVVTPLSDVQRYIGDQVRKAQRLQVLARGLERSFETLLKKAAPEAFENQQTGRKWSHASPSDITYTLNPGAFDEERLRTQRYLLRRSGVRLGTLIKISGPTTTKYETNTAYIGLDAISSTDCSLTPATVAEAHVTGTCRVLLEGTVVAKLRPYLNKVAYVPKRLSGSVGSTELLCISPKTGISAWYLYGVLKSELVLKQLRPLATGATHPRIDQYDVDDLVVPILTEHEALGSMLEKAQAAYFLAGELTTAAKFLVEALIDGVMTESDLVAAQQALGAGDDRLDRALLARLKTDGVDGEGPDLFPDLDQQYELLAQAEPA